MRYVITTKRVYINILIDPQDQVLKSGTLSKKAQRTKRWTKYWFVLKNDVVSWYNSSSVRFVYLDFLPSG